MSNHEHEGNHPSTSPDQLQIQIREEWYAHVAASHNGRTASSCHTCINFQHKLSFAQDVLYKYHKALSANEPEAAAD